MRVMAIDLGTRRIGLAIGDMELRLASAIKPLDATQKLAQNAERVSEVARREEISTLILGLPSHDTDDRAARIAHLFREHLEERGFRVELVDESFTTVEAHDGLIDAGFSAAQRKSRVDGEAARRILVRYFEGFHE